MIDKMYSETNAAYHNAFNNHLNNLVGIVSIGQFKSSHVDLTYRRN